MHHFILAHDKPSNLFLISCIGLWRRELNVLKIINDLLHGVNEHNLGDSVLLFSQYVFKASSSSAGLITFSRQALNVPDHFEICSCNSTHLTRQQKIFVLNKIPIFPKKCYPLIEQGIYSRLVHVQW